MSKNNIDKVEMFIKVCYYLLMSKPILEPDTRIEFIYLFTPKDYLRIIVKLLQSYGFTATCTGVQFPEFLTTAFPWT